MKILRVGPPRGKLGYQRVVLEDGTVLRIRPDDVASLDLRAEMHVERTLLDHLRARETAAKAAEVAYRLLAIRMRTRRELADRLRRRRIPPEAVDPLLDELERAGLLDDTRFAEAWVRRRIDLLPSGPVRLREELFKKGVAREVINQTLRATLSAHDEEQLAFQVARARLRLYRGVAPEVAYRRLAGVLHRRGFSPGVVAHVLREVLGHPQHTRE